MDQIQAELDRIVASGVPGAFAYREGSKGSEFWTAGSADLAKHTRMTQDMHYRVGSTTKTFTAVVALQLVEEGRLSKQGKVAELLPEIKVPNGETLTVEHLLRMRSGLFDFEDDRVLQGNFEAHLRPWKLSEVVALATAHSPIFSPGERFSYCNTNYCILEAIIENLTGRKLGEEFATRIFSPLGMKNTSYPDESDLTLPEPYVHGYERTRERWRECSKVFFGRGDGALISTARDLARFFRGLLIKRKLLSDSMLSDMMRVIHDEPPADVDYGMGLMADELQYGTVWGHAGGGYGYGNLPYVDLHRDTFVVFMRNASAGFHSAAPAAEPIPSFSSAARSQAFL